MKVERNTSRLLAVVTLAFVLLAGLLLVAVTDGAQAPCTCEAP